MDNSFCSHVNSFAVLLQPPVANVTTINSNQIISYVSFIGCSISALSLFISLVVIASCRSLRTSVRQQLLIGVCASLFTVMVCFLAAGAAHSSVHVCRLVSILLHFSILSSFCWMACYVTLLYCQLVIVFITVTQQFFWRSLYFTLSVSSTLVLITISLSELEAYDGRHGLCSLSTFGSFYASLFVPVMIMTLYNTGLGTQVIWAIMKTGRAIKKGKNRTRRRIYVLNLLLFYARTIISLSSIAGITWLLGALIPFVPNVGLQHVFAACNSLQGFFIFYFNVIRAQDVRTVMESNLKSMASISRFTLDRLPGSSRRPSTKSTLSCASVGRRHVILDRRMHSVDDKPHRKVKPGMLRSLSVFFHDPLFLSNSKAASRTDVHIGVRRASSVTGPLGVDQAGFLLLGSGPQFSSLPSLHGCSSCKSCPYIRPLDASFKMCDRLEVPSMGRSFRNGQVFTSRLESSPVEYSNPSCSSLDSGGEASRIQYGVGLLSTLPSGSPPQLSSPLDSESGPIVGPRLTAEEALSLSHMPCHSWGTGRSSSGSGGLPDAENDPFEHSDSESDRLLCSDFPDVFPSPVGRSRYRPPSLDVGRPAHASTSMERDGVVNGSEWIFLKNRYQRRRSYTWPDDYCSLPEKASR